MTLDRIFYIPIYQQPIPRRKGCGGKTGQEPGRFLIRPLVRTDSIMASNATGCKLFEDCTSCPTKFNSTCKYGRRKTV